MKLKDKKYVDWMRKMFADDSPSSSCSSGSCGTQSGGCCSTSEKAPLEKDGFDQVFEKTSSRRAFFKGLSQVAVGAAAASTVGCVSEKTSLNFDEYFKGNFRLMTDKEKQATVERLERLAAIKKDQNIQVSFQGPRKDVLFGYAFNISKCEGYMDCVDACVKENNLDRDTQMQYIRMFESKKGKFL